MSVTFIEYRPIPSWPPLLHHRPHDSAEAASRLAVENAERGRCVLLLTGVPDRFTLHATISKKPKAIRVVQRQSGFEGIDELVKDFSESLNNRSSKEWAAGARNRPVVIINDADYFFSERCSGELITKSTEYAIEQIKLLQKTLDRFKGDLIVMATKGWKSVADLFATNDHWCHSVTEEPPSVYAHGPLEGSQKKLACALYVDGKDDFRRLRQRAESKGIWVRMLHKRLYQVWFRTEVDFQKVKARMSAGN